VPPTLHIRLQASGITLRPERRYTILAPTDAAFAAALRKSLRMKPADLLAHAMADKLRTVGMQAPHDFRPYGNCRAGRRVHFIAASQGLNRFN
jgi:hypothetical protein